MDGSHRQDELGGSSVGPLPLGRGGFYRLEANQSSTSIFEDVEMAQDEVGHPPGKCQMSCLANIAYSLVILRSHC